MKRIILSVVALMTVTLFYNNLNAACNAVSGKNVDLEVTVDGAKKSNNDIIYITATPSMPVIVAKLSGTPDDETVSWECKISYSSRRPNDTKTFTKSCSSKDKWEITKDEIKTDFYGGKVEIKVSKDNKDCLLTLHIRGKNPSDSTVETYIGTSPWYALPIAKHESLQGGEYLNQFNSSAIYGVATKDSVVKECPNRSSDTIGYGIMQVTNPAPTRNELWSWKKNIDAGKLKITQCITTADNWMDSQRLQAGTYFDRYDLPADEVDQITYGNVTFNDYYFGDGTATGCKSIVDAVAIKCYNGATSHFVSWDTKNHVWKLNLLNEYGFNYVQRVCNEVQEQE